MADGYNPAHWSSEEAKMNIVWKELLAIKAVVNTRGHHQAFKKSSSIVTTRFSWISWKAGATKSADTMALVRMYIIMQLGRILMLSLLMLIMPLWILFLAFRSLLSDS